MKETIWKYKDSNEANHKSGWLLECLGHSSWCSCTMKRCLSIKQALYIAVTLIVTTQLLAMPYRTSTCSIACLATNRSWFIGNQRNFLPKMWPKVEINKLVGQTWMTLSKIALVECKKMDQTKQATVLHHSLGFQIAKKASIIEKRQKEAASDLCNVKTICIVLFGLPKSSNQISIRETGNKWM